MRADRLDALADGGVSIIDYKTGTPPSFKEVRSLSPQLPLEGLIARAGGFEGIAATEPTRIVYYRLSGRGDGGEIERRHQSGQGEQARRGGLPETLALTEQRLAGWWPISPGRRRNISPTRSPSRVAPMSATTITWRASPSGWRPIRKSDEDDRARLTSTARARIQREASDPRASAWVIANAGSGKTHVLTQRVIRLMLAGADPATILCLTFTKIAAAEMARRVFETLGAWTTLGEAELAQAIEEVQGRRPPRPRRCGRRDDSSPRRWRRRAG